MVGHGVEEDDADLPGALPGHHWSPLEGHHRRGPLFGNRKQQVVIVRVEIHCWLSVRTTLCGAPTGQAGPVPHGNTGK